MNNRAITILAISGSLRANSSNNAVLNAAAAFAPEGVRFAFYTGLASLPPFDGSDEPVQAVVDFRSQLRVADGILICSPEYAFGVPGALKNALDWTVSSGEFVNKPLALITAATGGSNAHAALLLSFTALSARVPESSQLLISFVRAKMNEQGAVKDEDTLNKINAVVQSLVRTIQETEE